MKPIDYAPFCGPGALAAVAAVDRQHAAKALAFWQRQAGLIPGESTPHHVLACALLQKGYPLEAWSPEVGGWRNECAAEFAKRMWRDIRTYTDDLAELQATAESFRAEARQRPRTVADRIVARILSESKPVRIERANRKLHRRYTVREWLARRSVGTWVLSVKGHWLAARAGQIVAGDTAKADEHGADALVSAWRVLPRRVFK